MNNWHISDAKLSIAAIIGTMTALWGWFGWLVIVWMGLMLVDWLTGSCVAGAQGLWSSSKAKQGVAHKVGQMIIFTVSLVMDWLIFTATEHIGLDFPFHYTVLISALVLVWYIVGELGSLVEHAVTLGAPVPSWLMKILEVSKNAVDAAGAMTEGNHEQ